MKAIAWTVAVGSLILPSAGTAISTVTDVVASNIQRQPLKLSVQVQSEEAGTVRFDVLVSSGRDSLSSRRCGTLTIWRDVATARVPKNAMGARPYPSHKMASANVSEARRHGVLCYSFSIHRSFVAQSTFLFANFEPSGMPAFDGYDIMLGDFLPSSESSPNGVLQPPAPREGHR